MKDTIAIIGLGYVGLPLAVEFGKQYRTIGFDINEARIRELQSGHDSTLEVEPKNLKLAKYLELSADPAVLADANIYIVTVPTPIDENKRPVLTPLEKSSETVGRYLKQGDIVIYESTVYPGCTEEVCVPILEKVSGKTYNTDFYCGYSPERINPGDKVHTVTKIVKVTSGSTPEIADKVDALYNSILENGTFRASSIKVAEASKIIENCQRDLNISFVNELALIFDRIGIDTNEVIDAAGSKWNFLKFRPGLVGGHCIGVDPYYMVHKAEQLGYYPEVILSGRRVNENIGSFVANKVVKLMIYKNITIRNANVLILGVTFKENCPDIRNSRVIDIIQEMQGFGCAVDIHDPWADSDEVFEEYGVRILPEKPTKSYDAIILAVAHREFLDYDYAALTKNDSVIYDVKSVLDKNMVDGRL
ncbi:MAG: nucleotide sugar dehydrogenase [Flavobacteriales bacterium]|nr:nucleotide sugar dehydrogenase [Flavobacteriales bacterium]